MAVTNDELRLRLDSLTTNELRALVLDHYEHVLQQNHDVEPAAMKLALMDYVDRRGNAERVRLADILSLFKPEWSRPTTIAGNGKAKTAAVYNNDNINIATTVAELRTQIGFISGQVAEATAQVREVHDALIEMKDFKISDWFLVRDAVNSLRTSVRWLMIVFGCMNVMMLLFLILVLIREG